MEGVLNMFVVARSNEYYAKIRVSKENLDKIRRAQLEMVNKGFRLQDTQSLIASLNAIGISATTLGLAFVMSTPAGIAAGITGIISFLGSGIPTLENLLQLGTLQLMNMVDFMTDNPQYDMVEFNIPWLSYVSVNNEALRFCQATSMAGWSVTAAHTSNGWQIFE